MSVEKVGEVGLRVGRGEEGKVKTERENGRKRQKK
jgi:hypothetical protein